MSKATTKARILNEITNAIANDSITPTIVGSILDEILELPATLPFKSAVFSAKQVNGVVSLDFIKNELGDFTLIPDGGSYYFQSNGLFTVNKTFSSGSHGSTALYTVLISPDNNSSDYLYLQMRDASVTVAGAQTAVFLPDSFNLAFFKIEVYN